MIRSPIAFVLALAPLMPAVTAPAFAQAQDPRAEQTDKLMRGYVQALRIPGAQIAVVKDGRIVFAKSYGQANVELGVPATNDTIFTLASISKSFTGLAAMQAVQAGTLDLAAPISQYLDDLPEAWRPITASQLLSHTSGLPDTLRAPTVDTDQEKAWAWTLAQPVRFAPGERFDYCQTNYTLIQRILNKLAGRPRDAMLADPQIAAAGMTHTQYADSTDVVPGYGPDYRYAFSTPGAAGVLRHNFRVSLPFHRPSNGLVGTAQDMARWLIALQAGKLLGAKHIERMWTPVTLNDGKTGQWGMGWLVLPRAAGHRAVGLTGGARSAFFLYPEDKVAVVILTNLNGAYPEDIIDQVAAIHAPGFRLSGVPALRAALEATGYANAGAALAQVRREDPGFAPAEGELNDWGYRLLGSRRTSEALAVMKLLVGLFPQSGNAFDSLGEAYAASGDKAHAIAAYRRAIELDPKNDNARHWLERLETASPSQ